MPARSLEYVQKIELLGVRGDGDAEHAETSRGRQQAIALSEGLSANGVKDELNAVTTGYLSRARHEILASIVDQMVGAKDFQSLMFRGRSRADDLGADVFGDLRRRYADAAAG